MDKKDPRVLTDAEEVKFLKWLAAKYAGWRLPVLWFQVKGFVGSRSFDITALRTEQLQDGCIFFPAETTKGREDRPAPLPPALYQELLAQAGPDYVFETFHKGLRECYKQNGLRCGNYSCKSLQPPPHDPLAAKRRRRLPETSSRGAILQAAQLARDGHHASAGVDEWQHRRRGHRLRLQPGHDPEILRRAKQEAGRPRRAGQAPGEAGAHLP